MNDRGPLPLFLFVNGLVGGVLMLAGLLAEARPHILLDVVLTPDEIRNEALADKTLDLMKRGAGWDSRIMLIGGAAVCATSLAARWFHYKAAAQSKQ